MIPLLIALALMLVAVACGLLAVCCLATNEPIPDNLFPTAAFCSITAFITLITAVLARTLN